MGISKIKPLTSQYH